MPRNCVLAGRFDVGLRPPRGGAADHHERGIIPSSGMRDGSRLFLRVFDGEARERPSASRDRSKHPSQVDVRGRRPGCVKGR
ncbi:MAG: hypothetical protein DPW13_02220 [Planctomycetes bacterium]|nr:hypothetical protein [Planctomycetota bacterium]